MYKLQNMSSKFKDFLPADLFLLKKSKIRKTSSQDQLIFQKSHQTQPITIVNLKTSSQVQRTPLHDLAAARLVKRYRLANHMGQVSLAFEADQRVQLPSKLSHV